MMENELYMGEPEPEVYDEHRWHQLHAAGNGYSPRTGHTVVAYENSLYVFGGTDRRRRRQDLFRYDVATSTWSPVKACGQIPPRRSGALGVVCGDSMILFGGYDGRDGNYFNDLFAFNFKTGTWSLLPAHGRVPEARTDHVLCLVGTSLYVMGGFNGRCRFNNLYRYSLDTLCWSEEPSVGAVPSRRFGHSGIADPHTQSLYIFGGWDGRDTLNDLYKYDLREKKWSLIETNGTLPPHRYRHTSVRSGRNLLLFGGVDKQHNRYNDLQRLCLETMTWSEVYTTGSIPSSRTFHRSVVLDNVMYVLGGYDGLDRLRDLYCIHVGLLSPPSLLAVCVSFVRNNVEEVLDWTGFDNVPREILEQLIWTKDSTGMLRGACKHCGPSKCSCYELRPRAFIKKKKSQEDVYAGKLDTELVGPAKLETSNTMVTLSHGSRTGVCTCGHPNTAHEPVSAQAIFRNSE